MTEDEKTGAWKKFPKHEQVKLAHHLKRLNMFYGGVTKLASPPKALFIVDVKKESVAFREAIRCAVPMIAMVDTNVNPTDVLYPIPANDDAVGSIAIITKAVADAYEEGKRKREKSAEVTPVGKPVEKMAEHQEGKTEEALKAVTAEEKPKEPIKEVKKEEKPIEALKKRGRPKKVVV
jgi:small subunit ribosomal protein S2